jgi:anti-sigma factor RsiW
LASLKRGDVTIVPVPDQLIMALADGELDPSLAAQVREAVDADGAARRKFEIYAGSRRLLASVFEGVLSEPIPERLKQTIAPASPNGE